MTIAVPPSDDAPLEHNLHNFVLAVCTTLSTISHPLQSSHGASYLPSDLSRGLHDVRITAMVDIDGIARVVGGLCASSSQHRNTTSKRLTDRSIVAQICDLNLVLLSWSLRSASDTPT